MEGKSYNYLVLFIGLFLCLLHSGVVSSSCNNINQIDFAEITYEPEGLAPYPDGTVANIECGVFYQILPTAFERTTCTNGSWTGPLPRCRHVPRYCQRNEPLVQIYGQDCQTPCRNRLNGACPRNKQCHCDGLCGWSCISIYEDNFCPEVADQAGLLVTYDPPERRFNGFADFSCGDGYIYHSGSSRLLCKSNRQWGGENNFLCIPNARYCQRNEALVQIYGQDCQTQCRNRPNGGCPGNKRCHCDGVCGWSCISIYEDDFCPEVADQAGLLVTYDPPERRFNGYADFSCGEGYIYHFGSSRLLCMSNRQWGGGNDFVCIPNDNQNPVITCPADFTSNTLTVSFPVDVTDNVDPAPALTYDPLGPGSIFPLGPTTVTVTATDSSSNQESCTFTVTVIDNQNPVITCPADLTSDTLTVSFTVNVTDNVDLTPALTYDPLGPGSIFPVGPTTVTVTATDSSSNQGSCTFTVNTVIEIICEDPGVPVNGYMTNPKQVYHLDDVVYYHCNEGYTMDGSILNSCTESGEWAHPVPVCGGPCIVPPYPRDGWWQNGNEYPRETSVPHNTRLQLRCNWRFDARWSSVKCNDGVWSDSDEIHRFCRGTPCEVRESSDVALNITYDPPVSDEDRSSHPIPHDTKVHYDCAWGYRLQGVTETRCNQGRYNNNNIPGCELVPCPAEDVSHGRLIYTTPDGVYHENPLHGDTRLLRCGSGYSSRNFSRSRCDNGAWVEGSDDIRCYPKPCDSIPDTMGLVDYTRTAQGNGKYSHGTEVTVNCNSGYLPAYGNGTAVCNASQWLTVIPTCTQSRNLILDSHTYVSQTPPEQNRAVIGNAWLARDGNTYSAPQYCSRTPVTNNPWWKAVMKDIYRFSGVKIYNCLDREEHRYDLVGAEIRVGLNEDYTTNMLCGEPVTQRQIESSTRENHGILIRCVGEGINGIIGNVISVHIPTINNEKRELSLCEIEVYEQGLSTSVNGMRVGCVVPHVENADISSTYVATQQVLLEGEEIRISCHARHVLRGSDTSHVDLTCLGNSSWDQDKPVCEPEACTVDRLFNGGFIPYGKILYNHGENITFTCNSGYEKEHDRYWCDRRIAVPRSPRCIQASCNAPDLPDHMITAQSQSHFPHDTLLDVSCEDGFQLSTNQEQLRCHRGVWSPPLTATCQRVSCRHPVRAFPSTIEILPGVQGYVHGTRIRYSCSEGWEIEGIAERECVNGQWTGSRPACRVAAPPRCMLPDRTSGQRYSIRGFIGNIFDKGLPVGERVSISVSCNQGYTAQPSVHTECLERGLWSVAVPICVRMERLCTKPEYISQVVQYVNGLETNRLDTYPHDELPEGTFLVSRCSLPEQYVLRGSANRTCSESIWTGVQPSCVDADTRIIFQNNQPLDVRSNGTIVIHPRSRLYISCRVPSYSVARFESDNGPVAIYLRGNGLSTMVMSLDPPHTTHSGRFTCRSNDYTHSHTVYVQFAEIYCDRPTAPSNGEIQDFDYGWEYERYFMGKVITFACNDGYILDGERRMTCVLGEWSHPVPRCQRATCKELHPPTHGTKIGGNRIGDSVLIGCNQGYQLQGEPFLDCQESGEWSHPLPACIAPPRCMLPDRSSGHRYSIIGFIGNIFDEGLPIGERVSISVSCNQGYTAQPAVQTECLDGGVWSVAVPICVRMERLCSKPGYISHVVQYVNGLETNRLATYPHDELPEGTFLVSRCSLPGQYVLRGSANRTCSESSWTGEEPRCVVVDARIIFQNNQPLDVRSNGTIVIHPRSQLFIYCHLPSYSVARFESENGPGAEYWAGYPISTMVMSLDPPRTSHSGWFTCRSNDYTHSHTVYVQFAAIYCDSPTAPSNGEIQDYEEGWRHGRNYMGKEITFACNDGYILDGERRMTCVFGEWSHPAPRCQRQRATCAELNPPTHGTKIGGYRIGDSVFIGCNQGYQLQGEPFLDCQESGEWSHPLPACVEIVEPERPCDSVSCEVWQKCETDSSGVGVCRCISPHSCPVTDEPVVCGTDGRNYTNLCRLKALACIRNTGVEVASSNWFCINGVPERVPSPRPFIEIEEPSQLSSFDTESPYEESPPTEPAVREPITLPPNEGPSSRSYSFCDVGVCPSCSSAELSQDATAIVIAYADNWDADLGILRIQIYEVMAGELPSWTEGSNQDVLIDVGAASERGCLCPSFQATDPVIIRFSQNLTHDGKGQLLHTDIVLPYSTDLYQEIRLLLEEPVHVQTPPPPPPPQDESSDSFSSFGSHDGQEGQSWFPFDPDVITTTARTYRKR